MEKKKRSILEEVKLPLAMEEEKKVVRGRGDYKSSTTSSIRLASTITKPDVKSVVHAVATIIHSQMQEDSGLGKQITSKSDLYFFCEEKYMGDKVDGYDEERQAVLRETPNVGSIYEFMLAIYDCAQFRYVTC